MQSALVVADIDEMKIRNEVRERCTERRKICLLIDLKIRKQFKELRNWSAKFVVTFIRWILEACDDVCGNNMGRRIK